MLEAIPLALVEVMDPLYIAMVAMGVFVGCIIGILPGIGAIVSMALMLGFCFSLKPAAGLGLIIGAGAVCVTADTITCVLMGVPGTVGSMATIMDGYPLAKKGEASRALGAAFTASMIGGIIGAICLTAVIPIALPLIKNLRSPHLFMLALLGIIMVSTLGGRAPVKGLGSAAIGMLLSAVGVAQFVWVTRFTGGVLYLQDGVPLVVVALGIFALPELIELVIRGTQISEFPLLGKGIYSGVKDALKRIGLVFRCSIIGAIIGFIPGMGQSAANWFAYGYVVNSSKDRDKFGKGEIRGVIAPESANNACVGGAIIPTVLFGIPGSGSMGLLLGAFLILGIQPGLPMLTENLHITLSMIWTLAMANVLAGILCLVATRPLALLTTVKVQYLVPFILTIVLVGAFQSTRHWLDLLILPILGIFGWLMKRYGWPRPALFVAFLLGNVAERYLYITLEVFGATCLYDPGVIVIFIIIILVLYLAFFRRRKLEVREEGEV
ncbi:MAG: tripartite tricarboxylate transporter permease [Dehalococcoidia bacterium]|nr:MAG: tripartite tricarboxylate transporter permease [Dehalococcoidia bacterium]